MGNTDKQDSKGQMPESLRTFEAAARADGMKPKSQGLTAKPDTAPLRDSPERKDDTANAVLRAGVAKNPKAATKAVQDSPDPRLPK